MIQSTKLLILNNNNYPGETMPASIRCEYRYNHTISSKYAFSSLGFDMYQATFEASLPRRPLKIHAGKWFVDVRFLKWQILINKMTRQQLEGMLIGANRDKKTADSSFGNPTFG